MSVWVRRVARLRDLARRHQRLFWTLHSLWALGWGIAFMAAGSKSSALLRYGLVSIGLVWATSLSLPLLLRLRAERRETARRLVLWGQKWLLQGLAFFILPVYHRSATYASRQALFMALLACAAAAVTIDVVYDEVVAPRRPVFGAFLAFTSFAAVNLILPMVWRAPSAVTLIASAAVATAIFASFLVRRGGAERSALLSSAALLTALLLLAVFGRSFVPPAPLRLVSAGFGTELEPGGLAVVPASAALVPGRLATVHFVAAIQAPAGLAEGVRHVWSVDGDEVWESRVIAVTGGRARGFRCRTSKTLGALLAGQRLSVSVETAQGQLIGRAGTSVRPPLTAPRAAPRPAS